MSAATVPLRRPSPVPGPLRTALVTGGWTWGVVALAIALGLALSLLGNKGKAFVVSSMLAVALTMFWAFLAGGRLVAMAIAGWQLRLPNAVRHALATGMVMLALAVALPAAVLALALDGSFAMAAAILSIGAAIGLFWASMPPWTMLAMIGLSTFIGAIPKSAFTAIAGIVQGPGALAMVAAAILLLCVPCWLLIPRRIGEGSAWTVPVAVQLGRGNPFASTASQNTGVLTPETPVGTGLAQAPDEVMGIALGPGFGRNSLRNVVVSQAPVVGVILLWLFADGTLTTTKVHMGLVWGPALVISSGMAPLARLLTVFWQPRQGLHELALLPGMPARPVPVLARQLALQVLVRAVPALAMVLAFAVSRGTPVEHCVLLASASLGSLSLLWGWTLVALHTQAGRWSILALSILLALASMALMTAGDIAGPMPRVTAAYAVALVAGVALQFIGIRRMRALPHPWLGN